MNHYPICARCAETPDVTITCDKKVLCVPCFERVTGVPINAVSDFIDDTGHLDLETPHFDHRHSWKAAQATRAARNASIATHNAWLIDSLLPHARLTYTHDGSGIGTSFAGSVVCDLRNGLFASDLSPKTIGIIAHLVEEVEA